MVHLPLQETYHCFWSSKSFFSHFFKTTYSLSWYSLTLWNSPDVWEAIKKWSKFLFLWTVDLMFVFKPNRCVEKGGTGIYTCIVTWPSVQRQAHQHQITSNSHFHIWGTQDLLVSWSINVPSSACFLCLEEFYGN